MSNFNLAAVGGALNLAADPPRARQNLVWLGMTVVALLAAPDGPSGWTITWFLIASILTCMAMTNWARAFSVTEGQIETTLLGIALVAAIVAVVISLVLSPLSGLFLLVLLFVLAGISRTRPFVTAAISVVTVPWWVWLATDNWHWQLLMLVPLVGLGLLTVSHILDTHAWPRDEDRLLTPRAHRFAAWMLMALTGVLIIGVGLATGLSRSVVALAGIVMAGAVPLEASIGMDSSGSAKTGVRIVAAAYLIAVGCWLAGIE